MRKLHCYQYCFIDKVKYSCSKSSVSCHHQDQESYFTDIKLSQNGQDKKCWQSFAYICHLHAHHPVWESGLCSSWVFPRKPLCHSGCRSAPDHLNPGLWMLEFQEMRFNWQKNDTDGQLVLLMLNSWGLCCVSTLGFFWILILVYFGLPGWVVWIWNAPRGLMCLNTWSVISSVWEICWTLWTDSITNRFKDIRWNWRLLEFSAFDLSSLCFLISWDVKNNLSGFHHGADPTVAPSSWRCTVAPDLYARISPSLMLLLLDIWVNDKHGY